LVIKRKYGVKYYSYPPFVQRLGITGHTTASERNEIFKLMKANAVFADITCETGKEINYKNINLHRSTNFTLNIDRCFNKTLQQFSKSFLYELKKSGRREIIYAHGHIMRVTALWLREYSKRSGITSKHIEKFNRLCGTLQQEDRCYVRTAHYRNECICAVILFKDGKRLYNILNYVSEKGRLISANYFLYHQVIAEFSDQGLIFDFEGSDIPGVKKFYLKFNPCVEYYYKARLNFAPWPLNYFV
jgi:hypothetical protein